MSNLNTTTNLTRTLREWDLTKLKLKEKFASLTDSDVLLVNERQDEMVERLQVRLGKSREEILSIIAQL